VIVPEASARSIKTTSAPENSFVQSPVPAPPHDGSVDQRAQLAAMQAKVEALQLADARRQAKLEALELAEESRKAKLEALQCDHKKLLGEVSGSLLAWTNICI